MLGLTNSMTFKYIKKKTVEINMLTLSIKQEVGKHLMSINNKRFWSIDAHFCSEEGKKQLTIPTKGGHVTAGSRWCLQNKCLQNKTVLLGHHRSPDLQTSGATLWLQKTNSKERQS